ncbi:NECAP-like protein CG9132 [Ornithodoros turicata]|uniref:Putative necap endocytosis associated 1 n=1 Tax=Ornithodoros turicata TaxID=34597 RepID=A0A2R5LH91_9ACAR
MEDYESILLVKNEVYVYKIPPRTTSRGYRAADWKLDAPEWTGRMRLVYTKGKDCVLKLEDKITGELFAKCPIDKYPGVAVEAVMDSSRYFVIRLQDDSGRAAFIGIGFADRGDSFDLNVALQDHFKWIEKSEELEKGGTESNQPQLDLSFKEGQTIKINMNIGKKSGTSKPKPRGSATGSSGLGLLPPPPGGVKLPAAPSAKAPPSSPASGPALPTNSQQHAIGNLLDLSPPKESHAAELDSGPNAAAAGDPWGDFTSAAGATTATNAEPPAQGAWIQF